MLSTTQIDMTNISRRGLKSLKSFFFGVRSGFYVLLLLAVALGAGAYSLRKYNIFDCQASGYSSDGYLAYCGATSYGDYDHGAFWFGLESAASAAAADAQVLFLGNSRTQFPFSSKATADWFSAVSSSYYLLGFTNTENYTFEAPLLRRLQPKAKVYVINIDSFFERSETGPGKSVMGDESARTRYEEKRQWQTIHKKVCAKFKAVCGGGQVIFRSRSEGAWLVDGGHFPSAQPVSYDWSTDNSRVAPYTELGREFLTTLPVNRECTILTLVPSAKTDLGNSAATAEALGSKLVAPTPSGLFTFDGFHLNRESAQRWSAAFLEEAGPQIRKCLGESAESHVTIAAKAAHQ